MEMSWHIHTCRVPIAQTSILFYVYRVIIMDCAFIKTIIKRGRLKKKKKKKEKKKKRKRKKDKKKKEKKKKMLTVFDPLGRYYTGHLHS